MALIPLLLVVVLAIAVAAAAAVLRRTPPSPEAAVGTARAHVRLVTLAATGAGALAAVGTVVVGTTAIPHPGAIGLTLLLLPVAFGVAHTGVLLVGELTWPRPLGQVRTARLVRRRVGDAAPRLLVGAAEATAVAAVAAVLAGILLASADGRSILVVGGNGLWLRRASPFPGAFYALPAGIGLLVLAAVTVAALIAVANRPAVVSRDERVEATLRRGSAHRVLRGATGSALVTVGGLLLTGGHAVATVATSPVSRVATAVAVLGGVAVVTGLVVLALPGPRLPRDAPLVTAG